MITGADGWSPTEPGVERALARAGDVTGIRQDTGLAFGDKETINAIAPATSQGMLSFDWVQGDGSVQAQLGTDGAIVDEGWAKEHQLGVGDRFTLKSGASSGCGVKGHRGSWIVTPAQQR